MRPDTGKTGGGYFPAVQRIRAANYRGGYPIRAAAVYAVHIRARRFVGGLSLLRGCLVARFVAWCKAFLKIVYESTT